MLIGENDTWFLTFPPDRCHLFERPMISPGLQQSFLVQLTALFDGVAAHYQLVGNTRKKMRTRTAGSSSHKQMESHVNEPNQGLPTPPPPILRHIMVGINEVTKNLETELRSSRQTVINPNTTVAETPFLTSVIFICYADLDTPALVAHLPQLVALCNSTRSENQKIKVVQLPAEAQTCLANALGYLKRVSVMALDVCSFRLLSSLLKLPPGSGPWTGPIGTPSCHCARSSRVLDDVHTRSCLGALSHKTAPHNSTEGYEGCQGTEGERTSCGEEKE